MTEKEKLLEKTLLGRPIAFYRCFLKFGGVKVALFLSQMFYWHDKGINGWFYKTEAEWEEETGLTRREQKKARDVLQKLGILTIKRQGVPAKLYYRLNLNVLANLLLEEDNKNCESEQLKREESIDNTMFVNTDNVQNAQQEGQKRTTRCNKSAQQDVTKSNNKMLQKVTTRCNKSAQQVATESNNYYIEYNIDYTENTTENTTENNNVKATSNEVAPQTGKQSKKEKIPTLTTQAFDYFSERYEKLYKTKPLRNAKTMSQMKQIVNNLPADEVQAVIDAFLQCREAYVLRRAHDLGLLLMDLNKYRVLAKNGVQTIDYKKLEKKAVEQDEWKRILKEIKQEKEQENF